MLRFKSLGSGSTGNATLIEAHSASRCTRVLVDCGFSQKELEIRLNQAGTQSSELDALFITHEHGDHVGCAPGLAKRHQLPLWMSYGTYCAIGKPDLGGWLHLAQDEQTIAINELQLTPFTVPHDAREPLQLTCAHADRRLGILTDLGCSTAHVLDHLQQCHALLLECNHDTAMLQQSKYPPSLKARIGGRLGHLANDSSAEILRACLHPGLKHVVAAHLSEQNNTPALARQALAAVLDCAAHELPVADPETGSPWLDV